MDNNFSSAQNPNPAPAQVVTTQNTPPNPASSNPYTKSSFSIDEALKFGWNVATKNIVFFIALGIISYVVGFIPTFFGTLFKGQQVVGISIMFSLIAYVFQIIINMGVIRITLKFVDNIKPEIADIFSEYRKILNFVFGSMLFGVIVVAGFIFFIIPGIIFAIRLQYYAYLIVDRGIGPIDAIKNSWNMTKGLTGKLLLFGFVLGLVNLLGLLALVVGLIVAVPTTLVAQTYVYRKLLSQTPGI